MLSQQPSPDVAEQSLQRCQEILALDQHVSHSTLTKRPRAATQAATAGLLRW
jgi:hypothetical protein